MEGSKTEEYKQVGIMGRSSIRTGEPIEYVIMMTMVKRTVCEKSIAINWCRCGNIVEPVSGGGEKDIE
jgi:hypothetical protein